MKYDKLKKKWQRERENRNRISLEIKSILTKEGKTIFKKYGITRVLLFGSVQNLQSAENSDIDILVMPLASESYWKCRHDLEEALNLPVDLYTQNDEKVFVQKVLSRGEVIYEV